MKNKKQTVEDLGVQLERMGKTPMTSRVFACLLISDPPERTFDEIIEFLGASKSAVSNALKNLQVEGSVKYTTKSGDRKRYFMIDMDNWKNKLIESNTNLNAFNVLLEDVIKTRKDAKSKKFTESIEEILEFQMYLGEQLSQAIDNWKKRK